MTTPYRPSIKHRFTIFDLGGVLTCFILWAHCIVCLYIARECALIHADEHVTKSMSQLLDLKRVGVDGNFLKTETAEEDENQPSKVYRLTYMMLADSKSRNVATLVFACIFVLAMCNPAKYLVLVGLWGVISSITCPLIVTVLPGCFFYYVLREKENQNKWLTALGVTYTVFGILILPIFLTLSTKNLFSATSSA